MSEFWLYILLGFLGGMIFCFLLIVGLIKKIIRVGIERGKEHE